MNCLMCILVSCASIYVQFKTMLHDMHVHTSIEMHVCMPMKLVVSCLVCIDSCLHRMDVANC
jgi:hypothetical protein